jgi:hypothetical protein
LIPILNCQDCLIRPNVNPSLCYLFSDEDDCQLQTDLHVAASRAALLLTVIEQLVVLARISYKLPLEERDVEDGGVVVDELQEVDLEGEGVVELGLGPVQLLFCQPLGNVTVNL